MSMPSTNIHFHPRKKIVYTKKCNGELQLINEFKSPVYGLMYRQECKVCHYIHIQNFLMEQCNRRKP